MKPALAFVLGLVVVVVLLIVAAYVWYNYTGWQKFTFEGAVPYNKNAPAPKWQASGGDPSAADLRFRDVVFTVVDPSGVAHRRDVTAVLNGMALAYHSAATPPPTLALDRPLNAFSFTIPGVNDRQSVPTKSAAAAWANAKTRLEGGVRTL